MIRVDPADWALDCRPTRSASKPGGSATAEGSLTGAEIPGAEIETLLRSISQALALGARGAEGQGYRVLCEGRARIQALDSAEHPWVPMLELHWCRIQGEYLSRHPGADRGL